MIFQYITNLLSGILLYRAGGEFEKNMRKMGTNLCSLAIFVNFHGFHWEVILVAVIQYLSLGTYWKGKEPDVLWYHWVYTGLGYGLSTFPLLFCGASWQGFLLRTYILVLGTLIVSEACDDVWIEECGRGALFTGTMILL